jgi:hypothetical protein
MKQKYPDGKISETDDGALNFRIFIKKERLIISFDKNISWIGLTKNQAIELSKRILKMSEDLPFYPYRPLSKSNIKPS